MSTFLYRLRPLRYFFSVGLLVYIFGVNRLLSDHPEDTEEKRPRDHAVHRSVFFAVHHGVLLPFGS